MPAESTTADRAFALQVVRTLREAGHEALFAGGCVRDQLLGVAPKDYDVATDAVPDRVREIFGVRRTLAVGAAFGVITVLGPKTASPIEVATFRTDAGYTDGRRPTSVAYTDAQHDAERRDFTINGLLYDPIDERVIDYVGGQEDLDAKLVRAIRDPEQRFDEDKLRMLRAVRFASTLGFEIEAATAEAVRTHAAEISVVSAERIGAELRRVLCGPGRGRAGQLLAELQLLDEVLPEVDATRLDELATRLDRLESPTVSSALAVLLVDSTPSRELAAIAMRLKYSRKEADTAAWIAEHFSELEHAESRRWSDLQPLLVHESAWELVRAYEAIDKAENKFCRAMLAKPQAELDPPPLVTGADLISTGVKPGPHLGEQLARIRAAQLDGEIATVEEALRLIK